MIAGLKPCRNRKPRGQGPSRRAEIMQAAKRIFLEEGVEHATMRRIAAAVGVSATALYVYFPDKEAILQAIAEAMFAELLTVHGATQQLAGTPLERLRAGLHAYVQLGLTRPDEYRLTFTAVRRKGPGQAIPDAECSFEMLEHDVAALIEAGVFRAAPAMLVAEALWTSLHGLVVVLLDHADHVASDHRQLVNALIDATIRGFSV